MENEIMNFSKVEEDPFAEIEHSAPNVTKVVDEWSSWKPTTLQVILNYAYLVFGITRFFTVIAVVLVDILLIYLILRYKRLKKNFNLYILHYAIINVTSHIIAPIFVITHLLIRTGYKYFFHAYCYMGMLEKSFLYFSFIFIFCLALDWSIFYFKDQTGAVQTAYKHKFTILYSSLGLYSFVNCYSCNMYRNFASQITFYSMPLFILGLLYMHYKRRAVILNNEQLKTEHYLWISTIVFGVYIPMYVVDVIYRVASYDISSNLLSILFLSEEIFSIISVLSPICILIYLTKWNKHVRFAFDITFRRTVREYGSDNLDDASDNEEIIGDDPQRTTAVTNGVTAQDILVP